MDQVVARQAARSLDDVIETGEAAAPAVEPAGHRLLGARLCDAAEAIGALVAYRAEPERATLADETAEQ